MKCPICGKKLGFWTSRQMKHIFSTHMEEFTGRMMAAMDAFREWKAQ